MRVVVWILIFAVSSLGFSAELDPVLRRHLNQSKAQGPGITEQWLPVIGEGSADEATALGAKVQTRAGAFFTARIPASRLSDFANTRAIKVLKMGLPAKPLMDQARKISSIDGVYQKGLDGSGVIVGVVDDSLDIDHADFKTENGLTRVAYFWDQTVASNHPPTGYSYGSQYSKDDIDAGRMDNTLAGFHGTHVTGIAAGSGMASGGVYRGLAPGAAIIFVKTDFSLSGIVDGINYILNKSKALNMPCVINLSLGTHEGTHTADDTFNQIVDQLITDVGEQGHIIVWAAGNEGGWAMHATNQTKTNGSVDFDIDYTRGTLYVDLWYTNQEVLPIEILKDGSALQVAMTSNDYSSLNFAITHSTKGSERRVQLSFSSYFSANYTIRLGATAVPTFVDAYLLNPDVNNDSVIDDTFTSLTDRQTVSTFCAQTKSISVGAMVSRTSYTNQYGAITSDASKHIGEICDFSSTGPTRDGQKKPDFAAPGAFIISAKGHDAQLDNAYAAYIINSNYLVEQGTSMAAPFVTGLVALLLQKEPDLTVDEVRQKIIAGVTSSTYKSNPGIWDDAYGYGIVDASFLLNTQPDKPTLTSHVINNVIRLDQSTDSKAIIQFNMNNPSASELIHVKIYSQDGLLIRDFGEKVLNSVEVLKYEWDGRDMYGRTVKPGIYQVLVEGSTFQRKFLRILVVH